MTHSRSSSVTTHRLPNALDPSAETGVVPGVLRCAAAFLDYDGTLTPIVARPELAVLSDETRVALRRLAQRCPVTIVSGRDIEVVRQLVQIERLGYVGSHGLDIVGPAGTGLRREVGASFTPDLDVAEAELTRGVAGIDGVGIERKRFSISTHVRGVAPQLHPKVEAIVDAVGQAHPSLRREGGKMLYELRPDVDWDKGSAVRWLLGEMDIDAASALYIGDDLTDETAFAALSGQGVTVVVADPHDDRPTRAAYRLDGPSEVLVLLDRLVNVLS